MEYKYDTRVRKLVQHFESFEPSLKDRKVNKEQYDGERNSQATSKSY